jgi:hypothetical protein
LVITTLAFSPCHRAATLRGPPSTPASRTGYLWAQRLAQLQVSFVYIASGGSKLLDRDWRGGLVLGIRFARHGYDAVQRGVPKWLIDFLSEPAVIGALSKMAIATELFLAFALWTKKARAFALWWGVLFHLTIELTSDVETFTWLTLTMYGLFVVPDVHGRTLFFDPSRTSAVAGARMLAWLDWLARFEVRALDSRGPHSRAIVAVHRDGSLATGLSALTLVARCIPILFPLWAPLALLARLTTKAARAREPTHHPA